MKRKQPTQVQVQQEKAQLLKVQVCVVLMWTDEQYCWNQYRQGLAYLRHTLRPDTYAMDTLERSAHFWGWFKNKWMDNDFAFLTLAPLDKLPVRRLRLQYRSLQDGRSIATHNPLEPMFRASIYKQHKLRTQCKR